MTSLAKETNEIKALTYKTIKKILMYYKKDTKFNLKPSAQNTEQKKGEKQKEVN